MTAWACQGRRPSKDADSPPGLVTAVHTVRHSPYPLKVYWRHTLNCNGVHAVLALPVYHEKPPCGILVGTYDRGAKAQAIRRDVFRVIHRYASGEEEC